MGSIPQKIPNPPPAADPRQLSAVALPNPLPRRKRPPAREPAKPGPSRHPRTPPGAPRPSAWKRAGRDMDMPTAQQRRAGRRGPDVPKAQHGTTAGGSRDRPQALQKSAERRGMAQFPEKTRTHSLPWAPPTPLPRHRRSPAREPVRLRFPKNTPDPPPPRATSPSDEQGGAESAARMCQRHCMGPLHGAAEIDRRACRREPQGAAWPDSPKNYEPIPCRGLRPLPCYAAGVPLLASRQRPGCQNHSGYPAAPHHRHLLRIEGQGGAARRSMDVR